jgi:hypothetical protein
MFKNDQFSCQDFISPLIDKQINISMDSKERALDNIFRGRPAIERFWRTIKFERSAAAASLLEGLF